MKPSLERTAVLSKDLTEQDENCKYVVMIPDANMILAADLVTHEMVGDKEGEIQVMAGGKVIAAFSPAMTWICIDRACVEIVKREDQLKRHMDNVKAEEALMDELQPGWRTKTALDSAQQKVMEAVSERFGQYL